MTVSLTPHSPDASIAHTPGPYQVCIRTCVGGPAPCVMSTKTGEQLASLAFNRNAESDAFLFVGAPELLDLAKAHEAWEADVILNADWSRELPTLTLAQWDRLIELQAARNAAIAKAEGRS